MTSRRDISPAEAAQITQRIDQFFNFMRDAIDDPRILDSMPSDSTLMFRDIVHKGQSTRLTAFLPKQPGAQWDARVTGTLFETIPERSAEAERQPPLIHLERYPRVAGYDTAEAALNALAAEIRADSQSGPADRRAVGA